MSKFTTWLMPSTSMPRAAISVRQACARCCERCTLRVVWLVTVDRLGGNTGFYKSRTTGRTAFGAGEV